MRARMALAVSGADPELREVVLRHKPAAMLEAGSKATVPLLLLADGRVLEESLEVMDWCLSVSDPLGWLNARQDATLCELLQVNDGPFKAAVDRYKYPQRSGRDRDDEAARAGVERLASLESALNSDYLAGASPGFFDAALFPFVRQFAAVDDIWFDALPLPNVRAWRKRLLVHPLFTTVMRKLVPWAPQSDPVRFRESLLA
ncbi:MAG: glutathione S-transferase C-terminal domain-containing protein [Nannocystaceae bacterium]|nr:glutathione S-transferase C-terminal domain-containing protein [Nannocystaceae bacterium]